jgi:phospholipid/cholesterol/gamma-HCH transport system permease protein
MAGKFSITQKIPIGGDRRVIELPGSLNREWVEKCTVPKEPITQPLTLDFSKTEHIDSAGIAFVYFVNQSYEKKRQRLVLRNISDTILSLLENWKPPSSSQAAAKKRAQGFFAGLGELTITAFETVVDALSMLTEILYWGSFGLFTRRDFRRGVFAEQMFFQGYNALGIVVLLSFLIGVVLALQAAIQLNRYGGGGFFLSFIGISLI